MVDEQQHVPDQSRRHFLSLSWRALGLLVTGEGAYLGFRYLASRDEGGIFGEEITVGRLREFPPGTITPFPLTRMFLVCFPDGGYLALYSRCTHLACIVGWNEEDGVFQCPCHGSEFDREGRVLNQPAPRPLDRFPITIQVNGKIKVDTGKPIKRNTIGPDDLTYSPEDALT